MDEVMEEILFVEIWKFGEGGCIEVGEIGGLCL